LLKRPSRTHRITILVVRGPLPLLRPRSIEQRERRDEHLSPRDRRSGFGGNPYLFLGPRPFREARLRSYILSQHRRGRPLSAILADPYVRRCGSESFCWRVLQDPRTIEELERHIREAIQQCHGNADITE
jgi:hypothetical protein